jgi:hypothetical protein
MIKKQPGKVPSRIAAELRYLGRERDFHFECGDADKALLAMELYDRVFCRWYFAEKPKHV